MKSVQLSLLNKIFLSLASFIFFLQPTFAAGLSQEKGASQRFYYEGHAFFNAAKTGIQGGKYLLNQQLSNVKLFSVFHLNDTSKIQGLLIYNTLPTPITPTLYFEQLFTEFKLPKAKEWYIQAGKKWLPFGNYKNDLIYKSFTKALGQTNEYTVVMGYDGHYYANLSFFPPHTTIRSFSSPLYSNVNFGVHDEYYDVGVSYIDSLAESQLFQYNKGFGGFLADKITSHVPGVASYMNVKYQSFNTYLTLVSALHPFRANEVSFQNKGAAPKAFSLQQGYQFKIKQMPAKFIGFYDHSYQALALRLPQKRVGVGLNLYPHRYLDVQFQVFKDYSYPKQNVGAGLGKKVLGNSNIANTFALQLVLNF